MMVLTFVAGGLCGAGVVLWLSAGATRTWHHALITHAATLLRLSARWVITDAQGTFVGRPTETLAAFLHRYTMHRSTVDSITFRTTTPDAIEER